MTSYIVSKFVSGYTALESTIGGGDNVKYLETISLIHYTLWFLLYQQVLVKVVSSINTTAIQSPEGFILQQEIVHIQEGQQTTLLH